MQARADNSGRQPSVVESFAQLRDDLTNDNFLSALGKFAVDDPARLDRLSLANLRENKRARNNLAALNAARTCLFGARQMGSRNWYKDTPGIASRLKTQAQRRQFRLGLIANLAFYNKLNISDLCSIFGSGNSSGFASMSATTPISIPALRSATAASSPYDVLRVLAPEKAGLLEATIRQISALADYVQSLCSHLAANEALEPAHAVICKLLRTGADFEGAVASRPIHVAAAAMAPLCPHPDVDGVLQRRPSATLVRRRPLQFIQRGYCFAFQNGACTNRSCHYRHVCSRCRRPGHGMRNCSAQA